MSNAKKCDRCGKYFDENNVGTWFPVTKDSDIEATPAALCVYPDRDSASPSPQPRDYELCDSCWEKLLVWLDCPGYFGGPCENLVETEKGDDRK